MTILKFKFDDLNKKWLTIKLKLITSYNYTYTIDIRPLQNANNGMFIARRFLFETKTEAQRILNIENDAN